ncbi:MAG: formate dehydrogenase subunit alpha, partial [Acidobacteria bacterium]
MTNSIPEIREADFLFVTGSNTTEAHPIIAMEMKRAVQRGAKLAVGDPRAIWLTEIADWHLQLKPGSDVWLLNAMAHVIVSEGLENREWIEANTEGFDAVRETVLRYPPEEAEKVTGVPAEMIREVARAYATTEKAGIYYTLGITEHTCGTDNVYALSNLVLMTGHLGIRSAGMNPLRGQNNVQGANDSGATPTFYPGY